MASQFTVSSYARNGIELQQLPEFLTVTLGLKVQVDEIKTLLDALMILFTYESEEEKREKELQRLQRAGGGKSAVHHSLPF